MLVFPRVGGYASYAPPFEVHLGVPAPKWTICFHPIFHTTIHDKKGSTEGSRRTDEEPRKKVTLYLPPSQWRALKVHSAETDREMSEIVSEALQKLGIG